MKQSPDPPDARIGDRRERAREAATDEQEIDQILADTFPASDPPPWTLGVAETPPPDHERRRKPRRR